MTLKLSIVLVALALVVAGCGGKKKAAPAAPTTTAAAPATTASSTPSTPKTPTFASAKNCQQLAGLGQQFAKAIQASTGSPSTKLTTYANAFQALASAAPSAIRGDFETIASAFGAYAQALSKADLKPGTTPSATQMAKLAAAAKSFDEPKLRAAEQHLSAWAQKNCGGIAPTTTG